MTKRTSQSDDDDKWRKRQFIATIVRITLEAADLVDRFLGCSGFRF
jgi:hypothetical protein